MRVMRSFVAGLAVFLAFLTGTAALGSYVARTVLLDPARVGQVVEASLRMPDVRDRILARAVPGYARLPGPARAAVAALADDPGLDRAARRIVLRPDGTVGLEPLQREIASRLRGTLPQVASVVGSAHTRVTVPATYVDRYQAARDNSRRLALGAALVTAGLLLVGLVVTRRRRRTVRSIGIAAVLSALVVGLLYWAVPSVLEVATANPLAGGAISVVRDERSDVLLRLLPVVVVGLVLAIGAVVAGSDRRSRADRGT